MNNPGSVDLKIIDLEAGERQLAKSPAEKPWQLCTPVMMAKNSTYSEGYDWGARGVGGQTAQKRFDLICRNYSAAGCGQ